MRNLTIMSHLFNSLGFSWLCPIILIVKGTIPWVNQTLSMGSHEPILLSFARTWLTVLFYSHCLLSYAILFYSIQ